jgi:hypothetical protein
MPSWIADTAGTFMRLDPTLSRPGLEAELAEVYERTRDMRAAGREVATAHCLPEDGFGAPLEVDFEIGNGRVVRWTPNLVSLIFVRHDRRSGEKKATPIEVIPGLFRPLRRLRVEGETYYTVEFGPGIVRTGTFEDLFGRLEKTEGRVLARAYGHDVVAQLLYRFCKTTEDGWPTYGFYPAADGTLVEARTPTPVKDEQERIAEQVAAAVAFEPKPGELAAYSRFAGFYEPWEILPLLGLAAISPFALAMRQQKVLIPHVLSWSHEHNVGKSTAALAVSDKAFGREHVSASTLNSEFRYPANSDACCGPLTVEEAEQFNWDRWGGDLKTAAESPLITKRGGTSLAQRSYLSRGVLFFSANFAGIVSGPALVRFFVLHYAEGKARERRSRSPAYNAAFAELRPVGPSVARGIINLYPTVTALLRAIDSTADAIVTECSAQHVDLHDPRRPRSWAATWIGLQAWASLASDLGDEFPLPDLPTFVRDVVARVEAETFEGEVTPLAGFRSWFESYKVAGVSRRFEVRTYMDRRSGEELGTIRPMEIDSVRGEGRSYEDGSFELLGMKLPGDWVTKGLLDLYNREQQRPDLRFTSLRDLMLAGFREADLSESAGLDPDGKVPRHEFRHSGRQRAAFVLKEWWTAEQTPSRVRGSGEGVNRQSHLEDSPGPARVRSGPVGSGAPDPAGTSGPASDPAGSGVPTDGKHPTPDPRTQLSVLAYEETTNRENAP